MNQEVVYEEQVSHHNLNSVEFSLTADQLLYLERNMPKGYAFVDGKKKKEKKDPIMGDVESQSQSVQAARGNPRRVQAKENNTLKKLEAKKNYEDQPVVKAKYAPPVITLSNEETSYYQSILSQIKKHKNAFPFLVPVDPVQLEIPDYFEVIRHPMDLSTIQKKLKARHYQTPSEFTHDLNQIWVNSYSYNPKGSDMYVMTTEMEKFSHKLLVKPTLPPTIKPKEAVVIPFATKKVIPKEAQKQTKKSRPLSKQITKVMTVAQKKQLKSDIEGLPLQYLGGVWEIVAKSREEDETIVDLNGLEFQKLKKLDAYCKDVSHFKKKEEKKVVETTIEIHDIVSEEESSFLMDSD